MKSVLTAGLILLAAAAAADIRLEFRGAIELPQDLTADGQVFGGISGVAYDTAAHRYHAVADDLENARFFTLTIDLSDGTLDAGDVAVTGAVLLKDIDQKPFPGGALDPEGIVLLPDGTLMIAAEAVGDRFPAFIRRYAPDGTHLGALATDHLRYDPRFDAGRGTRPSGGYESLVLSPDGATLWAAFEKPLKQDSPDYDAAAGGPVRMMAYDLATGAKTAELVYRVEPMTLRPEPAGGWHGRGLNDLAALDAGRFLSIEREYAQGVTEGVGTRPVEIFEVRTGGATDIRGQDALGGGETTVSKTRVLDLDRLRARHGLERIGSHEVLVLGPDLPDGRRSLILIEDNDFQRPTQILLFALSP